MKHFKKTLYCFIGPSGSGKSSIAQALKSLGIPEVVSHTTREARDGEIEGIHYYFISDEEYDKINKVEQAFYASNKYCVSKEELNSKFKNNDKVIAVVEMEGYKQLKKNCSAEIEVISVYIKTDIETMRKRMTKRNDDPASIEKRINNALATNEFDNEKLTEFIVDNRGDFATTIHQARDIIFTS